MLKITINLMTFSEQLTGIGKYTKQLIKYLQKNDTINQYYLYTSCVEDPKQVFGITQNNFFVIQKKFIKSSLVRVLYEQIIFPFIIRGDIYFSPSMTLPILMFFRKTIVALYDLTPFVVKSKFSLIKRVYLQLSMFLTAHKADKIITISQHSKRDIVTFLRVDNSKITIVYPSLETQKDIVSPKIVTSQNVDYFLSVSTIQPGKNFTTLLSAFEKFKFSNFGKGRETYLYIVGKLGWQYEETIALIDKLQLNKWVQLLGYVNDDHLSNLYYNARAFFYISYYEGFGIPPLEAMYFGCPVVVSNTSSLPEVTGKAAIYIDPYDSDTVYRAMIDCYNEELMQEKRKFMNSEVAKFNPEKEIEKILLLFASLSKKL